ncbi:metallophosphoesterase family protein [Clostridium magnum]|uniref:3',5'-cyclic adenosine monophosphate phosphodiesterase CpdA n=1 Tax=Clostridium magnum DSM 2767 TaxID=1121326 RepID=A0A162RU49_9CLOT|nr:metallophosphoesterase family protein [Clostridium magnum]KZL90380.1 3',5'-cyclic adenosine monophosphate phosphodiesterase CpdA [Clostridium magnum DSM 2767]SHH83690.1 Calcineurin-like phosphoesterase [Clostridium magnum DSM 2767]
MNLKPFKPIIDLLSFAYCNILFKITYRNNSPLPKYPLKFDTSRNFKIVQFADIQDGPNTDPRTLELMNRILDKEKPNLVVLTGDNIDGKCKTAEDVKKAITNISKPMESRNIPWAVVFGNHDDEHFMMSKEQMMNFYMTFNYNVSQIGFKTENRVGNYNLLIHGSSSQAPKFNVYFIDSGKYSILGVYDYITKPQICWYKTIANNLKKQYKKTIPAIMFFHIPLQEFYTAYKTGYIDGLRLESESTSSINTGLFDAIVNTGDVKGIFVGHDHSNTYTAALNNITLGYAGNVGYATYGNPKLQKGARIFEINEANPSTINTRMIFSGDVGLN